MTCGSRLPLAHQATNDRCIAVTVAALDRFLEQLGHQVRGWERRAWLPKRVRFVGFGAEGTCESLSFLSGTGEVAMTGAVRVQVKDKLGRVESELSSDRLQYRIDAAHLQGLGRP